MQPKMKYYLIMSAALVLGFGGFIVLVLVVFPNLEQGSILMPLLILAWALAISLLLAWRYRVGKNDPEIAAQNKKEAQEFSMKLNDKESRKASRRNRGAYGGELIPPSDRVEDDEEDEE